jgi:hypothetical protein
MIQNPGSVAQSSLFQPKISRLLPILELLCVLFIFKSVKYRYAQHLCQSCTQRGRSKLPLRAPKQARAGQIRNQEPRARCAGSWEICGRDPLRMASSGILRLPDYAHEIPVVVDILPPYLALPDQFQSCVRHHRPYHVGRHPAEALDGRLLLLGESGKATWWGGCCLVFGVWGVRWARGGATVLRFCSEMCETRGMGERTTGWGGGS